MRFAAGLLFLVGCSTAFASQPGQRTVTFEDRARAQHAIEQVYWNHRIWRKENPGPKPPLSTVMSDKAIRDRVTDNLKKSGALDTWWQRPITADQLQAEMDRMAKSTRDATVLRELFTALRNDPFVIAETLARQTLVDRLIRSWYANDTRFHGAVRVRVERAHAGPNDTVDLKTLGGEYHETVWVRSEHPTRSAPAKPNEVQIDAAEWTERLAELKDRFDGRNPSDSLPVNTLSPLKETSDGFSVVMVLESSADRVRVASVVWPKTGFTAWWASQAPAVEAGSTDAIASPEGSYVLPAIVDSTCTPDTWQPTKFEMPLSREGHTVVWTGTEMIVWGGNGGASPGLPGGRYCVDICSPSVSCGDASPCTTDTCDPVTGCVFSTITAPPEIQSLAIVADKATYSWPAATHATRYDVVRGSTGAFPIGPGGDDEVCFDNLAGTVLRIRRCPIQAPGSGISRGARTTAASARTVRRASTAPPARSGSRRPVRRTGAGRQRRSRMTWTPRRGVRE